MSKVYMLPYLRKGLVNNLTTKNENVAGEKRARINVQLSFMMQTVDSKTNDYNKNLNLDGQTIEVLGPADVKSVNKRAIVRVSPAENSEVKLNRSYMPYIEFYEEDLPWRYTPFAPESSNFYPWMALIAVKPEELKVTMNGNVKVANLTLTAERYAQVFPKHSELRGLAHVQIAAEDSRLANALGSKDAAKVQDVVNEMLDENPDCGISRVLCASELEPSTDYVVLLVPVYELGRRAALGENINGVRKADLSWQDNANGNVAIQMPIYKKWKFTTAVFTDNFNNLANKLFFTSQAEYAQMKANLDVDISQSGLQSVYYKDEEVVDVPAALVLQEQPEKASGFRKESATYTAELKNLLNLNPVFDENESGDVVADEDPWVVPPVYGARHQLTTREQFGKDGNVVHDVNLQLRNRIAAGLGGSVVKKNQEEFVNRAWKKVEVVNTLNQMLREYYQMNEVNQRAKEKNVRQDIDTDKVTDENRGVLYDAALRMLQSSGIYYNSVAPDTMLHEVTKMKDDPCPTVQTGMPIDFLKGLYDHNMWMELAKKDHAHDEFMADAESGFEGELFMEYDYLAELFDIKWYNGVPFFFADASSAAMSVVPSSLLTSDKASLEALLDVCTWDNDRLDAEEVYDRLDFMKERYPLFDAANMKSYRCIKVVRTVGGSTKEANLRVMPIRLNATLRGLPVKGFVVSDEGYDLVQPEMKPLVVNYYVAGNTKVKNLRYFVFVPKSYLDKRGSAVSYSLQSKDCTYFGVNFDKGVNVSLDNGKFSLGGTWDKIQNFCFTKNRFYRLVKDHYNWMKDHLDTCYYVEKSKTGKKYESKDSHKFQIVLEDDTFRTSLKGKEYPWLEWNRQGSPSDKFFKYIDDKKKLQVFMTPYRKVLKEIMDMFDSLPEMISQPSDVTVNIPSDDCRFIDAQAIFVAAKNALVSGAVPSDVELSEQLNKLLEYVDRKRESIDTMILEANAEKAEQVTEKVETNDAYDLELPDPDALGRQRIEDICKEYGVTEMEQLKKRVVGKYPVMIHPDFLDPTYFYLREMSVDYVLPASGSLLKNTISCFYSNPMFEESYLMGMNTEMGKELLWREYPTDQRGSYFRKFWDQTTLPKKDELEKYYDVKPLEFWNKPLGNNHNDGKGQKLVFAIKGELMQAFPDTDVYLQGSTILRPDMTSWLTEDTYLVGFTGIKKEQLRNYRLVFRQKPMSLQFTKEQGGCKVVRPCCYLINAGK